MSFRPAAAILGVILVAALAASLLMQQAARQSFQRSLQLSDRQHMHVHHMLLEAAGLPAHEALPLPAGTGADAIHQFEAALNTLLHGGPVDLDGLTGAIPPAPTPALAANLRQAQAAWVALRPALEAYAAAEPGSQAHAAAVGQVNTQTPILVGLLDEHRRLLVAEAERVNNQYVGLLWVLRITLLILTVLVLRFFQQRVFNPLLQLREATRQISQGDLGMPVALTAIPEVEQMVGSLEAMRQRLNNSAREQAALLAFSQRLLAANDAQTVLDEAVRLAADLHMYAAKAAGRNCVRPQNHSA